jgi:hypothetical protein
MQRLQKSHIRWPAVIVSNHVCNIRSFTSTQGMTQPALGDAKLRQRPSILRSSLHTASMPAQGQGRQPALQQVKGQLHQLSASSVACSTSTGGLVICSLFTVKTETRTSTPVLERGRGYCSQHVKRLPTMCSIFFSCIRH